MAAVDPGIQAPGPRAHFDCELLRQAGRLPDDRLAHLGAGGELADRTSHLIALDQPVDELVRARTCQRLLDQAVERPGSRKLGGHPLRHAMRDERVHEVLR